MLPQSKDSGENLLEVKNLKKYFPVSKGLKIFEKDKSQVQAVNDVSFSLKEGETYGLVGESGCGKSTTGRTLLRLVDPTSGEAFYKNQDVFQMSQRNFREIRQEIQMVFQDMYSSLNPRKKIGQTLEEPMVIHSIGGKKQRTDEVMKILEEVGLNLSHYYKYPHQFSGGQRQRVGIARALMVEPKIIIHDEPVSALDASVQSQIINLLQDLQDKKDLTYLFIAHDISVVRHISDRIGIMYLGKLVEEAPTDDLFKEALHPYTKALFSAVPVPDPKHKRERIILRSEIPSPLHPPSGCVFHTRCPHVMNICKRFEPQKKYVDRNRFVACHLYDLA